MGEKRKQVDAKLFSAVKIMLNGGATYQEVAEFLQMGVTTVGRIKNADTYDDFLKNKAANRYMAQQRKLQEKQMEQVAVSAPEAIQTNEPQPVQVVEHRQTVTIQATHYMMEELKRQTDLLTLIGNKLTAIMEDLGCLK